MKNTLTIKRGAVCTTPVGLAGFAGRIVIAAVVLLLISGVLGGRAWAITGGGPDNGQHPYVAAMIAVSPVYGQLPFSGTLIHPRVILTAGHTALFVVSGEVTLLGVSLDENVNVNDPSTWLSVSRVIYAYTGMWKTHTPPGYGQFDADIGIIILDKPVVGITPATLPPPGLLDWLKATGQLRTSPDATEFTQVGYGYGLVWPPPQPIWPISEQGIDTRKAAQSGYMSLNSAWLRLSQNQVHGYGGGGLGDSGGPALWTDPSTGVEYVVGICSGGDMAWVNVGNFFRVDTPFALQFIQDAIASVEE